MTLKSFANPGATRQKPDKHGDRRGTVKIVVALLAGMAAAVVFYLWPLTSLSLSPVSPPTLAPELAPHAATAISHSSTSPAVEGDYERRKAFYKRDIPLSAVEERQFFAEISHVFLEEYPAVADTATLMPQVIKLNERYQRGVRSILTDLQAAPAGDDEVRPRIARVDYLKYRLRWDEHARSEVATLVARELPETTPIRFKAVAYAERLELVEGLVTTDWSLAMAALAKIKDPVLAQRAAQLCYAKRVDAGVDSGSAEDEVMLAYPGFRNKVRT